jgi:hypothetical protein
MRRGSQSGQASVELVVLLPIIAVLAGFVWQLAIAGQAIWLAGAAARAAARADAVGADSARAARGVLPETLEKDMRVRRRGAGSVQVTLPVRSVLLDNRLITVASTAHFEPQGKR